MVYFDNAATTGKKPMSVVNAVDYTLKNLSVNPGRSGHSLSVKASEAVYKTREKTADFFGAESAEQVIFTLNCTHSLNYVLKGILRKGDHVIVSDLEHNAVMRPLYKTDADFDIAEVDLKNDDITVDNFRKLIKNNTKMIICTGASNVLGRVLPIAEIGKICRKNNILFCVDAAQISGVKPIDMKEMNIDFLCVAPHKGLYAPMGIGVLIACKPIYDTIIEGGTGTHSAFMNQPDLLPERFESGTINLPSVLGLGAGIDFVKKYGIKRIYSHEYALARKIYDRLSKMEHIRLYTPDFEMDYYMPVISFNVLDIPSETVAEYLNKKGIAVRGGLHCAPSAHRKISTVNQGAVRISTGVFNTENEAEYVIKVLQDKKILKM